MAELAELYADLSFVLDGPPPIREADLVARLDGINFVYKGVAQVVYGEPEAGKTWLALWTVKEWIEDGGVVVYLDYEMSAEDVGRYLLYLGADPHEIIRGVKYAAGPDQDELSATIKDAIARSEAGEDILVVVDSWDEALYGLGVDEPNAQKAGTVMAALVLRPVLRAGGTVLAIDHATTRQANKKRGAAGSFRKLATVMAAMELVVLTPPQPGGAGRLLMKVAKDRPGWWRRNGYDVKAPTTGKLEKYFGTLHIDSTADPTKVAMWIDPDVSSAPARGPSHQDLILTMLAGGPRSAKDLQTEMERDHPRIGKKAAGNALSKLKDLPVPLVEYDTSSRLWALTEAGAEEAKSRGSSVTAAGPASPDEDYG